jgi:hypothetical protein
MQNLKKAYRVIYCPDDVQVFYDTEKAADAIEVHCKELKLGKFPEMLKAYAPSMDLILHEDDERWPRIKNIIVNDELGL